MREQRTRPSSRRRSAVHLGIPVLLVAVLALVALWRVSEPPAERGVVGTSGSAAEPLNRLADVLTTNAVGREASIDNVAVRQRTSRRTLWVGDPEAEPVFVVLDPDAQGPRAAALEPGTRWTLVGIVRPVPDAAVAKQQWQIDESTARALVSAGTYLHVTEIRTPSVPQPVPRR